MNIPNLPTDNYYKFIALTGVTICIISILFYSTKTIELFSELRSIESELEILDIDLEIIKEELDIVTNDILKLGKPIPDTTRTNEPPLTLSRSELVDILMKNRDLMEYYKFIFDYEDKIYPNIKKLELFEIENNRLKSLNWEAKKKTKLIKSKADSANTKNRLLMASGIILILLLIAGWRMAKYGFSEWYNKVQKPSDEKLAIELEKLKVK